MMDPDPPFLTTYKSFFDTADRRREPAFDVHSKPAVTAEECSILPIIDLRSEHCKEGIASASSEWGFFQVVNHGIPQDLLERMRSVLLGVFRQPFERKAGEKLLDFSADSYRWGTPSATSLQQLSWSEAYHIPLVSTQGHDDDKHSARLTIEEFASIMSRLAHQLLGILAEGLGCESTYLKENCTCNTCYLRLNHYPPCRVPRIDGGGEVFGLIPHTDSDFLTILFQDQVGGLQLMKGGRWITVEPNPSALVINIGDLCEAWSNGVYRSVEHRVMSNPKVERFSVAYFLCPSYDTMIQSHSEPAIYRKFTFKEYRQQVQEDVKLTGHKVGLARFLA